MKKLHFVGLFVCSLWGSSQLFGIPEWWTNYSLTDGSTRQDDAIATLGQAKHAAQKGYLYLEAELTSVGGAGAEVTNLHDTYCTVAPTDSNNDSYALTLGQLKFLVKPFYDRLNSAAVGWGTTSMNPISGDIYPWTIDQADDADLALATIGQLKFVFSFDLSSWSPSAVTSDLYATPSSLAVSLEMNEVTTLPLLLNNSGADSIDFALQLDGDLPSGSVYYSILNSVNGGVSDGFSDISSSGTELASLSNVDDGYDEIILPFNFPFYGTNYPTVYVSSNGFLSFVDDPLLATSKDFNSVTRSQPPDLILAPFMCDLDLSASADSRIYYKEESGPDRFIIQYNKVSHADLGGEYTFQVVLYKNGEINFYYDQMVGGVHDFATFIEGVGGSGYRLLARCLNGSAAGPTIQDGTAFHIVRRDGFFTIDSAFGSVVGGGQYLINVTIDAGVAYSPGQYEAILRVLDDKNVSTLLEVPISLELVNRPTDIFLKKPASNQLFSTNQIRRVVAYAADDDFGIDKVEFLLDGVVFYNTNSVNADNEYTGLLQAPSAPGTYQITARAVDDYGAVVESVSIMIQVYQDADDDDMDDLWEQSQFGSFAQAPFDDYDQDGIPNIYEFQHGTNPTTSERIQFSDIQSGDHKYFIVDSSLTEESEYKKLTPVAAIAAANDYDVIEIKPGVYQVPLGSIGKRLFIFGSSGARSTVFDFEGFSTVPGDSSPNVAYITEECIIQGITIQNTPGRAIYSRALFSKNGVCLQRCRLLRNEWVGIYAYGKVSLVGCTLADNLATSKGSSIYARSSSYVPTEIKMINTIIWDTFSGESIYAYAYGGSISLLSENSIIDLSNQPISGTYTSTDPLFGFDYSLTAASPAVDAGINLSNGWIDCDGELVTDGLYDIGADEFRDADVDALPDWIESGIVGGISPEGDADGDYLENLLEYETYLTNPLNSDTDEDGFLDAYEVRIFFTDPTDPDGLFDAGEVMPYDSAQDLDGDGLSDTWEYVYGFNPFFDTGESGEDADFDARSNLIEYLTYTNPLVYNDGPISDSDSDGMTDIWELQNGFNPFDGTDSTLDEDGDGLTNYEEFVLQSDPNNQDQNTNGYLDGDDLDDVDGDGILNGWERSNGLDLLDAGDALEDPDHDDLSTYWEYVLGYNYQDPYSFPDSIIDGDRDYDGDLMSDSWEIRYGLDPFLADAESDPDLDGLKNYFEFLMGTDPFLPDSDGDLLSDWEEDFDNDGIPNGWELLYSLDPFDSSDAYSDADTDGMSNLLEFRLITNPLLQDSDLDGLLDGDEDSDGDELPNDWEYNHGLNPLDDSDSALNPDGDLYTNLQEFQAGTNPSVWDTNSDGIADGDTDNDSDLMGDSWELSYGLDPSDSNDAQMDLDADGSLNYQEYVNRTNPMSADAASVYLKIYTELE